MQVLWFGVLSDRYCVLLLGRGYQLFYDMAKPLLHDLQVGITNSAKSIPLVRVVDNKQADMNFSTLYRTA